jgi:hypothetical protein
MSISDQMPDLTEEQAAQAQQEQDHLQQEWEELMAGLGEHLDQQAINRMEARMRGQSR